MLTLQEISSLAILIPVCIAGIKLKTGDLKLRLFFGFLLFGAVVDGLGFLSSRTNSVSNIHGYFLIVYIIYEAFFFLWIASSNFNTKFRNILREYTGSIFLLSFGFKFYLESVSQTLVFPHEFSSFYLIVTSFLSGFSLLRMSEQIEDLILYPWFWILSGIFLYSFGTFFIDALLYTQIIEKIWGLRNYLNIIQYGFFVMGLILLLNKNNSNSHHLSME